MTQQLSPLEADPETEANEREAKRLRTNEPGANFMFSENEPTFAFMATEVPKFLEEQAVASYVKHCDFYQQVGVLVNEFVFGMKRNDFSQRYHALAANPNQTDPPKKKGRKEIKLSELPAQQQRLFTEPDGSDDREWKAWQNKQACDVLSLDESLRIRREKPDLIVPTRWVRTNKHDGWVGKVSKTKALRNTGEMRQRHQQWQRRLFSSLRLPPLCAVCQGHQECLLQRQEHHT